MRAPNENRLLGRYELIRPLARGGMAEVYLARRRGAAGVEKRLVIKRIRPEHAGQERSLELFVREARLSVALTHQNIVPVFDFGRVGNELFLAMEHVDGRDLGVTLERLAERGKRLDPVLVAYIGAEACAALDYAHRKRDEAGRPYGIVHRDVTPRNVLLSFAGEVKLADFGVAGVAAGTAGAGEDRGRLRGTPAYMAPEQARGEAIDGRSDLFALGLVLWEALTGRRAYLTDEAAAAVVLARAGVVPPLGDDVPDKLRAAIARATQPDPAQRYADAREMQQALDGFVLAARTAAPNAGALSHRLAAELGEFFVEGEATTSDADTVAPIPAGPVATFVDDGADEVAALRSLAHTVADEPAAAAPDAAVQAPAKRPARGLTFGLLALALAAATAFVVYRATRPDPAPTAAEPPATAATSPAAAPSAPPGTAPTTPLDSTPPAVPPAESAPPAAPSATPPAESAALPRQTGRPAKARAAPEKRPVLINSKPWSYVSVDGERERHQTIYRIDLSLGKHNVRFTTEGGITKELVITVTADGPNEFVESLP